VSAADTIDGHAETDMDIDGQLGADSVEVGTKRKATEDVAEAANKRIKTGRLFDSTWVVYSSHAQLI
jgi:hypothetical protein